MFKISKIKRVVAALLLVAMVATACGGGAEEPTDTAASTDTNDESPGAATEAAAGADSAASTSVPTAEPTTAPTPEPTAEPTPEPEPTPDPLLVEAEQIALEWGALVTDLFADPRNTDLSRLIALEAGPEPRQPLTDWTLRSVANLIEENRYQPPEGARDEIVRSQWDPDHVGQLAWVDVCIQTSGVWLDIETDEEVFRSNPDPAVSRYRILTDSMTIAAVTEDPEGTGSVRCEFSE